MSLFDARRTHAALAATCRPFATLDTLHLSGRCPQCERRVTSSGIIDDFAHLRDDPWADVAQLSAWIDRVLADPPPLAAHDDPTDSARCACGAERSERVLDAAVLVHPVAGAGAALLFERRVGHGSALWRAVDDAPPVRVTDALRDAFGRDLTLAESWRALVEAAGEGACVEAEPGCWIVAAPERSLLRARVAELVEREPACVVLSLGAPRGASPARCWTRWLGPSADALRAGRCFAAFALDRARFAECAALTWQRVTGRVASVRDDSLALDRGGEVWTLRLDEACLMAGQMALTLSEAVRVSLDEVWRRLDALDRCLQTLAVARTSVRFERSGDVITPLLSDGTRGATLSLRALAFETPPGTAGFERALRYACDPLPPWADASSVCPCGAPVLVSARLVPYALVDSMLAAGTSPAVLSRLPDPLPVGASVVALGCDLHAGLASESTLAALGFDAASLARRIRHDATSVAMLVEATLHDDEDGHRALAVTGPWASSAMLDDQHLSALHGAFGEPLGLRRARVVTVSPDALVLYDPAMREACVDALLTSLAQRVVPAAALLLAREARLDALPLGRYLPTAPIADRPARVVCAGATSPHRESATSDAGERSVPVEAHVEAHRE